MVQPMATMTAPMVLQTESEMSHKTLMSSLSQVRPTVKLSDRRIDLPGRDTYIRPLNYNTMRRPQRPQHQPGRHPREYGFTLVELLVVVGIIALLIGLLLPALATARERASTVKCASNLQQTGMAITLWTNEHNNQLPPFVDANGNCIFAQMASTGYLAGVPDVTASAANGAPPVNFHSTLVCPNNTTAIYVQAVNQSGFATASIVPSVNPLNNEVIRLGTQYSNGASQGTDPNTGLTNITTYTVDIGYAINGGWMDNTTPFAVLAAPKVPSTLTISSTLQNNQHTFGEMKNPSNVCLMADGLGLIDNVPGHLQLRHGGNQQMNVLFADGRVETKTADDWILNNGTVGTAGTQMPTDLHTAAIKGVQFAIP